MRACVCDFSCDCAMQADGEEEPKADDTKTDSAAADGKEESPAANGKDVEMIDAEEQVTVICCRLCPSPQVASATHGSECLGIGL